MTVKLLVTGFAAAAAIGAAGLASAVPATVQVQPVVFGVPMPLDPPPPAPATGAPLPSTAEVAGLLTKLTDPAINYKEKGNLVENGITGSEGHGLDHDLRKASKAGALPYTFNVANVEETAPGQAVANVTISGPKMAPQTNPLQLVDEGGSWVLSHDSAVALFHMLAQP